ncbi:MAG: methyltransferase domain-containing protein [Polyangiaceae bacterium]|nr:methyltransferase domain-containing protein [Polyangiaceae bacterium]
MSSFVWMKVLESTPERYDRGVRMLSRGRIAAVYERIAEIAAAPGRRVLDVGTGTGAVALACAARGADVMAIDIDAGMLEMARQKADSRRTDIQWKQASAAEIEDVVPERSLDAVVSCLAFSELSQDEQSYALRVARTRLVPGGVLVIADEAKPEGARGALHELARLPLAAATYLLTQTTTRPVKGLVERVREAGFVDVREERRWGGSFVIVEGRAP